MSPLSFTQTFHTQTYPSIDQSRPELSSKDKTIYITCGNTISLGSIAAVSFANSQASKIGLLGNNDTVLQQTKSSIQAQHPNIEVHTTTADLTSTVSVGQAAHNLRVTLGAWDVFVNAAGFAPPLTTLTAADEEDWETTFKINVGFIQIFSKHFLAKCRPDATYISINSAAAYMDAASIPRLSAYAASNLAAVKANEFLHAENQSLRVFTIHPGTISSETYERCLNQNQNQEQSSEAHHDNKNGNENQDDDPFLPANFLVWLTSSESEHLRGRFLWANWDVEELVARKDDFKKNDHLLKIGLNGVS